MVVRYLIGMRWRASAAALAACGAAAVTAVSGTTVGSASSDLLATAAPHTAKPGRRLLLDVAACGPRLIAVGEFGLVATSEDGGRNWQQKPSPTSVMLTAVACMDERRAWVVGHDGVVLATLDGGERWQRQLDGGMINRQMQAAAKARLAITPAGGEARQQAEDQLADAEAAVAAGPSRPLFGVRFVDARTGYASGSYGQLLQTQDGGASWTYIGDRLPNPSGLHLYSIASDGPQRLWIAAEAGVVFRTVDGGATWARAETGYSGNLHGIVASDNALLAYGFRGHLFRSTDGGARWAAVTSPVASSLIHGAAAGNGRIVVAGQDGELIASNDAGQSFQLVAQKPPLAKLSAFTLHGDDQLTAVGLGGAASLSIRLVDK